MALWQIGSIVFLNVPQLDTMDRVKKAPPVTFGIGLINIRKILMAFSFSPAGKWKSLFRAEQGVTTGATVASINKTQLWK